LCLSQMTQKILEKSLTKINRHHKSKNKFDDDLFFLLCLELKSLSNKIYGNFLYLIDHTLKCVSILSQTQDRTVILVSFAIDPGKNREIAKIIQRCFECVLKLITKQNTKKWCLKKIRDEIFRPHKHLPPLGGILCHFYTPPPLIKFGRISNGSHFELD
jgi:hypothetical protein